MRTKWAIFLGSVLIALGFAGWLADRIRTSEGLPWPGSLFLTAYLVTPLTSIAVIVAILGGILLGFGLARRS
jgi:hypothetical protein